MAGNSANSKVLHNCLDALKVVKVWGMYNLNLAVNCNKLISVNFSF